MIVNPDQLVACPLARETGVRHVAVAHPAGPMTAATETVRQALRTVGAQRRSRSGRC